jgi:hypothetical protein
MEAPSPMYALVLPLSTPTVTDSPTPIASSPKAPAAPMPTSNSSSNEVAVTARPRTDSVPGPLPSKLRHASRAVPLPSRTWHPRQCRCVDVDHHRDRGTKTEIIRLTLALPADASILSCVDAISCFRRTEKLHCPDGISAAGSRPANARVSVTSTSTAAPPAPATELSRRRRRCRRSRRR